MPITNEDFVWTEDLIKEMIHSKLPLPDHYVCNVQKCLDEFKKSKQVKKPLFRTDDGLDIYDGMDWWIVDDYDWKVKHIEPNLGHIMNPNFEGKRFSTEAAAKKYALYNRPFLTTLKEIKDTIKEGGQVEDKLVFMVKNKINKNG